MSDSSTASIGSRRTETSPPTGRCAAAWSDGRTRVRARASSWPAGTTTWNQHGPPPAPAYWVGVVVISVFGTVITDNLSDHYKVALTTSTPIFAVILAMVFAVWYAFERTLSIHTIITTRREAFYWLAILFTFALGTAAGDLVAEKADLGYAVSIVIFGGAIAVVTFAHYVLNLNAILSFWLAHVLTRP